MEWLGFALAVLATYRIARMIAREDGPFDVFMRIRDQFPQEYWIGRGLNCVLCLSFWISLPAALLAGLPWHIGWMGVAGGTMVLFIYLEG